MLNSFTSSRLARLLPLAAGLLLAAGSARAVLIDFDVASDYNTDFTEVTSGTDSLSYSSSAGVGGVAGRVNVLQGTTSDTTAIYTPASFDLSNNDTFTLSLYFLIPNPIGGAALITAAQVGFVETTSTGFLASGTNSYASARVRSAATGSLYFLEAQGGNNGAATNYNASGNFTLNAGEWYQLTANFTRNGSSSLDFVARVDGRGATGNGIASLVQSINGTMAVADMAADSTAFGAFRANGQTNNKVVALDDFLIVPEPATGLSLLAGFGMLALIRRRRA